MALQTNCIKESIRPIKYFKRCDVPAIKIGKEGIAILIRQLTKSINPLHHIHYFSTLQLTSGAGTAYPSRAPEFTPGFQWGLCYSIFSCICMFCRSLFVLLYFFFWPLCCLFFFDIRILITLLVSSNFWPLCCLFFFDIRILITLLVSSHSSYVPHWLLIHLVLA